MGSGERVEYGSVLPNASEPDVFYDSLEAALADCAFGPCRIVSRTVTVSPWTPVSFDALGRPAVRATPGGEE